MNLADGLLLKDYIGEDNAPKIFSKGLYYWKKGLSKELYEQEANRYVDFATDVIRNSGYLMIQRLKIFLSGG